MLLFICAVKRTLIVIVLAPVLVIVITSYYGHIEVTYSDNDSLSIDIKRIFMLNWLIFSAHIEH